MGGVNFWFARFPLVNKDPETFAPFQYQVLSLVVSINLCKIFDKKVGVALQATVETLHEILRLRYFLRHLTIEH